MGSADPARRVTFAGRASPFVAHALALAAEYCTVAFEPADPDRVPALRYGRGPAQICIPAVDRYTVDTVPGLPGSTEEESAGLVERPFPFDLFAAMRFWLVDEGNRIAADEAFDVHDRLKAPASAQEARGLREVPIVNAYLMLLRRWLRVRLGITEHSRLPEGRSAVVVLSHDVDQPLHPADPRNRLWIAAQHVRERSGGRAARHAAGAVARAGAFAVLRPRARHWLFSRVIEAEARRGLRSTFMFAATSRYDAEGTDRDVAYDVRSPRFRRLFRELEACGCDIGLHIGYGARDDTTVIARERERLEAAAGVPVLGSRHHYWHMARPFWPTLQAHAGAGLHYDSSISFNDAPGYRLGVALAFHPWDPLTESAVKTLQIPTLVMDGALLMDGPNNVDGTVAHLERLLRDLTRYEGTAAFDWHDYSAYPAAGAYASWGRIYLELLDLLAANPRIAVRTYQELTAADVWAAPGPAICASPPPALPGGG